MINKMKRSSGNDENSFDNSILIKNKRVSVNDPIKKLPGSSDVSFDREMKEIIS